MELKADLLVLLSDVDGLYSGPPSDPRSKLIHTYVKQKHQKAISFGDKSRMGRGGMDAKVKAAAKAAYSGTPVVIARSRAIDKSKLLQALYNKQKGIFCGEFSISTFSGRTWKRQLQDFAISQHRSCLHAGSVDIYQWKGHSDGINRCKMKMGLLLTGGTGKVMRLWSIERYKCLAEYYLPHTDSLIDFNFDESKVVGLVGNHICLWRRNERKSIFSSQGGQFPRSSCMCYVDPEAVVGGEDGRARVFDMYGRKWSRIIKIRINMNASQENLLDPHDSAIPLLAGSDITSK